MSDNYAFNERLSSNKTEMLFLALTLFFVVLSLWRFNAAGFDVVAAVFVGVFGFFLFCSLNYRTLAIRLTPESLELRFGVFSWTIATDNIENCYLDDTPMWRIGGAGVHFSPIRGRYRAMFNFLEYPRVVIALKKKRRFVRDIAFSTRQPDEVMRFIRQAASTASTD
jgi:hypothetical protein